MVDTLYDLNEVPFQLENKVQLDTDAHLPSPPPLHGVMNFMLPLLTVPAIPRLARSVSMYSGHRCQQSRLTASRTVRHKARRAGKIGPDGIRASPPWTAAWWTWTPTSSLLRHGVAVAVAPAGEGDEGWGEKVQK